MGWLFISEYLRRDIDKILFKNVKTVKLPQEKSVINLLKEEDEISIIYKNFQKIAFHDHSEAHRISHVIVITQNWPLFGFVITEIWPPKIFIL